LFELLPEWIGWQEAAVFLLLGLVVGLLAGLLGVGGGLVIVPALLWLFQGKGFAADLLVHLAVGTSLATIIITSLSSIHAHHKRKAVEWRLVKWMFPGIVAGALVGAALAGLFSAFWLQRVFACFAILVGIQMALGVQPGAREYQPGRTGLVSAGSVIGMVSSIVGIGGGSMTVPYLHMQGVNLRHAVATSSACGLPIALAGALGFVVIGWGEPLLPPGSSGFIYWPAVIGITAASILVAPLGVRLAHTLPVGTLRRLFALLLLAVGLKLLTAS
jgi:uncharacterized membrane protein YfcA